MTGRILGQYEILEKLGEGGMGIVYKARDTRLGRFAAIKLLPAARVGDAERRTRFMQEARAASALNHPNIITVYEVNGDGDEIYIAMELVTGKPLGESIPAGGMKAKTAIEAAMQISDALAKAHGAGIVHRDLKPGNVMLTAEGRVKLLDFGLAKWAGPAGIDEPTRTMATITQEGSIVGTAAYMSPEQAEGKAVDWRSDIFSFGAMLYEMLCGRRAFGGASMVSTLAAVIEKDPAPIGGAAPRELERIVARCLRKDPARRYQHAGDIRMALEEALADVEAARSPAGLPAATAPSRTRWIWPAITAAALLAAGAAWWLRPQASSIPDLSLQRLTGDPGLSTAPAISPDGKLIAYASDRAGNGDLDIWVQHRGGGEPIRVTHDPSDEFDPSFSTDGSQIVYAVDDGIYIVPALGGQPQRLARGSGCGRPRLSPDGKRLVYDANTGSGAVYLLDVGTQQPKQIAEEIRGFYPVWSPDGHYLLLMGRTGRARPGWYLLPVDSLKPIYLGSSPGMPEQWLSGDRALFINMRNQRATGVAGNLGLVTISPKRGKFAGTPQRLTNNTSQIEGASLAADGTLVLDATSSRSNLWALPLNGNTGKATGALAPVTEDVASVAYPSISADGTKLAFQSDIEGYPKIWLMDMVSRQRHKLTPLSNPELRPVLSPDGTRVTYRALSGEERKTTTMAVELANWDQPGAPAAVCDNRCTLPWSWWPDNRGFLVTMSDQHTVALVSARGGAEPFAHTKSSIWQFHPSPDGKWMVLMEGGSMRIAKLSGGHLPDHSQWKLIERGGDLCRWSPDGNMIYFYSRRDRFRCIWARRLDPATKEPTGDAFAVYHAHAARLSMQGLEDSGAVGLALARDRLVLAQAERAGNIWIGKLVMK